MRKNFLQQWIWFDQDVFLVKKKAKPLEESEPSENLDPTLQDIVYSWKTSDKSTRRSSLVKMVTGEMKVATVDVESSDNMATLPVGRTLGGTGPGGGGPGSHSDTAGKDNAANKEMELKNVMPKPLQKLVLSL